MTLVAKLILLAPALAMAACGSRDGNAQGADISINAKNENGSDVAITADGQSGKVAIALPGFNANIALPKAILNSANFDIDGVKLYPGSKVTMVNVDANKSGGADQATVKIGFTSPADPPKVRDWFVKAFADKSMTVTPGASGLSGTNDEGDPFTMTFAPGEAGTTTGRIEMTDSKN